MVSICIEVEKEFVDLVDDFGDAGIWSIDFVDHKDDRKSACERLSKHETGLRERTFSGVNEKDDSINHR